MQEKRDNEMKTWKLTLIYLTLLVVLSLGILVVEVQPAPPRARAKAYFYPRTFLLDGPPDTWEAWLHFSPKRTAEEINASTILLEGIYPPSADPYDHPKQPKVVVPFDPHDIMDVAILKLYHNGEPLEPGSGYLVTLEITGLLIGGTPFSTGMSGSIVLFIPDLPPP